MRPSALVCLLLVGIPSPVRADDRLPTEGRCSPDDEPEIVSDFLRAGELLLKAGNPREAERKYRATLGVISQRGLPAVHRVRGSVGLARSLTAQEKQEDALQVLEDLEYLGHHCVAEEHALISLETDPEAALLSLAEARASPWASWAEKGRLVMRYGQILMNDDPTRAAAVLAEERGYLGYWLSEAPSSDLEQVLELASRLWHDRWERESLGTGQRQDLSEPEQLLEMVVIYGTEEQREKVGRLREEIEWVRALEAAETPIPGWGLGGPFERADEIRRKLDRGEAGLALTEVTALALEHPSAENIGLLGDVYWTRGQGALAYAAYRQAASAELIPGEWHTRWVLDPQAEESSVPDPNRVRDLERASRSLQPDPVVLIRLARAYRRDGRADDAREKFRQAESILEGLRGPVAASSLADIEGEIQQLGDSAARGEALAPFRIDSRWEESASSLRVAWAMAASGEQDLSHRAFLRAERLAPDPDALHAFRGALAWLLGDEEAAVRSWNQGLAWDPSQRTLSLHLGQLYMNRGEVELARSALERAGVQGLTDAYWFLALLEWSQGRKTEALQSVQRYLQGPLGRSAYRVEAQALAVLLAPPNEEISAGRNPIQIGLAVGGVGLILGLFWWRGRRTDLVSLLEEFPDSGHDMARILSAIRHEVLKHNTTLLDEVADALEHGDHHAVSFAAIRLFGMPGGREGGVALRFEGYLQALEGVGNRYRRRLEIRRSDEVLGPMCRAIDELQGLEAALRRPWRAGPHVPGKLRRLSRALNETGYRALGALLQQMGTIRLECSFFEEVDARVRLEPALADTVFPKLAVEMPEGALSLRIFHGDLQDIVANLLRNAMSAGMETSSLGVRIRVEEEEDLITGIEHVAIRVLDRAADRLRNELIRGRSITRGLGLVTDLLARHEGTLDVEHREDELEQGWTKALVLRLRRMEMDT